MMNKLMKALLGSCHEATLLLAKKEEGKLSFGDGVKLSMHISLCKMCRNFEKQTLQISDEARQIVAEESLSTHSREKIATLLSNHIH